MILESHRQRMDEALASETPYGSLYHLAKTLRDEGVSQMDLYLLFSSYIEKTEDNDLLYDALMDTMDLIWGGGVARGNGFYPTELTNEMIDAERKRRAQESKDAAC